MVIIKYACTGVSLTLTPVILNLRVIIDSIAVDIAKRTSFPMHFAGNTKKVRLEHNITKKANGGGSI